jgi:uncharacterized lipoprotein YajG
LIPVYPANINIFKKGRKDMRKEKNLSASLILSVVLILALLAGCSSKTATTSQSPQMTDKSGATATGSRGYFKGSIPWRSA